MSLPRIRSMRKAYDEIVENDPETSISYYNFRQLIVSGAIPSSKNGKRYMINMDDIEKFFIGSINTDC